MSSVTETSTSALGKQGEMLFFLVFQGAKLAVCVFVRMGVAPELWIKAEIVREGSGKCDGYQNRLVTVPVVTACVSKGIVG